MLSARIELRGEELFCADTGEGGASSVKRLSEAALSRLRGWAERYDAAVRANAEEPLVAIGHDIAEFLDEGDRWLTRVLEGTGEIAFEIAVSAHPEPRERLLLDIPWELLAPGGLFLAADNERLFRVARRLGRAAAPVEPRYRDLALLFMAAEIEGQGVLDYEQEEAALLQATKSLPLNLSVEESGTVEFLGPRLAQDGPFDALHLSCHGEIIASPEPSAAPEADKAEYVAWYGTNRRPNDPADPGKGYSAMRDRVVHYGSCRVFIPKSHKIGSIGSPWWKRLLTLTDDRLRLLAIGELAETAYWGTVAAHLAMVAEDERSALIFVHGYNVSFEDAALRAAQIGFDLSVKGAMAFFSWPSQGVPGGYAADAATIEASEDAIADFMTEFAERSGAKAVHVIAHSMGNRGVLRAVNRIAAKAQRRSRKPFGQIILAAADVDADLFRQLCLAYGEVASRTTLYISKRDLALEASH